MYKLTIKRILKVGQCGLNTLKNIVHPPDWVIISCVRESSLWHPNQVQIGPVELGETGDEWGSLQITHVHFDASR